MATSKTPKVSKIVPIFSSDSPFNSMYKSIAKKNTQGNKRKIINELECFKIEKLKICIFPDRMHSPCL